MHNQFLMRTLQYANIPIRVLKWIFQEVYVNCIALKKSWINDLLEFYLEYVDSDSVLPIYKHVWFSSALMHLFKCRLLVFSAVRFFSSSSSVVFLHVLQSTIHSIFVQENKWSTMWRNVPVTFACCLVKFVDKDSFASTEALVSIWLFGIKSLPQNMFQTVWKQNGTIYAFLFCSHELEEVTW